MGTEGADERRVRQLLHDRGVSYAPQAPAPVEERPRDWLDDILDERPDASPAPAPRLPDWRRGESADLSGPAPDGLDKAAEPPSVEADDEQWEDVDEPDDAPAPGRKPRRAAARRVHAEYLELPGRTRWLLYTGSAAGAGYWAGLVPLMNGWITNCGHDTSPTSALILGLGIVTAAGVLIDRRTRHWWGPLPWLCRIPLASALLALALYAPGVS